MNTIVTLIINLLNEKGETLFLQIVDKGLK